MFITKLPLDIIVYILSFDNMLRYRNGVFIDRIQKEDYRNVLLLNNIHPITPIWDYNQLLYAKERNQIIHPTFYRRELNTSYQLILRPNWRDKTYVVKFLRKDGKGTHYVYVIQ